MRHYTYKAKDKNGAYVSGEVEASSVEQAAKLVREKGLIVITVTPVRENVLNIIKRFRDRITPKDVATFTRQLATMINAGLPLTEALLILRSQSKGAMQKMVAQVLADIEGGESFSSSLKRHPDVFTPTYIALIKSGEVGGVLDDVLSRLADNLEKSEEFKGKVKGAMIYPIIIILGMIGVAAVMMIFVIPRLTSLYKEFNANLPTATKILIGVSEVAVQFWPFVLVLLGFGIWGLGAYRKTAAGRRKTDELIFKIPIFGDLQKQIILTELTRTLSMMVGAGVSILEGLNIAAGVVGNVVVADALKDTAKQVEKGFPVAYAFSRHPEAFPFILTQMIAVGEETGKVEDVLKKVSRVFEIESDEKVKTLTAAIEPIVMVVLGIGVAFLVIAIIMPIYNLTSQF